MHGGASLQEVVLPVIHIHKKRKSDISYVDVDIIGGAKEVISSGQLTVVLYQQQPISDKVHPRKLSVGLYTKEGNVISDIHEIVCDFTSENARERELKLQFILSRESEKVNNQEVMLKLMEIVPGTSRAKEYKSTRYQLRRSFMSDFEL